MGGSGQTHPHMKFEHDTTFHSLIFMKYSRKIGGGGNFAYTYCTFINFALRDHSSEKGFQACFH